jgi:hypothetical protein
LIELAKNSNRFSKECAHANYKQIVEYLLEQKADVDSRDAHGNTALIYASKSGNIDLVEFLIHYGATLDLKGRDGNTALHEASSCGFLKCVQALVESGANINEANMRNLFPLELARINGHFHVEEYLRRHQAALKHKGSYNRKMTDRDLINNLYLTLESCASRQELSARVIESFDEKTFLITKAHLEALEKFDPKSFTKGFTSDFHLNLINNNSNPASFFIDYKEKMIECIRKQQTALRNFRVRIFNYLEKSLVSFADKQEMKKRLECIRMANESALTLKELNRLLSEQSIQEIFAIKDQFIREQRISILIKSIELFEELVEKKLKLTSQFFDIAEEKHFLFKIKAY